MRKVLLLTLDLPDRGSRISLARDWPGDVPCKGASVVVPIPGGRPFMQYLASVRYNLVDSDIEIRMQDIRMTEIETHAAAAFMVKVGWTVVSISEPENEPPPDLPAQNHPRRVARRKA